MAAGVYKITSPSGKIYIGQSNNIDRRYIEHKSESKNYINKFYSSIRKYGFDTHKKEILFLSDVADERTRMEQFYINYFNTIDTGLNHIQAENPSLWSKGRKHTQATKDKIRQAHLGIIPKAANAARRKKIYCGANNKTYKSISDCALDLNVSQPLISMMINGKTPNKFKVIAK